MEDKPRYSRISDILELLIAMNASSLGITLSDIEKKCGVSRRTAERMRDSLLNTRMLPICELESTGKEKRWGFMRSYLTEIIGFTPEEIASLETVKQGLKNDDRKTTLDKVILKLKAMSKKQNATLEDRIEFLLRSEGTAVTQNPNHKIDIQALNTIREAINTNRKIETEYGGRKKLFAPYGIIYGSNIYLIGVEGDRKEPYVYLLHKFKDIKLTKESFDKGDFDIKEYANRSFGVYQNEIMKVELLFGADVKDDVLNFNFHPTQKMKVNPDNSVTVKFKASGPLEIIWHLFRWGDSVKIISPKSLKKEYIDWLERCLKAEKEG